MTKIVSLGLGTSLAFNDVGNASEICLSSAKTEDPWISLPVIACLCYLTAEDGRMFVYHRYESLSVIYPQLIIVVFRFRELWLESFL